MANDQLPDQIRESLTPLLEPGEQLRAVGRFQSGGLVDLPSPTFFVMRNWWVGATDRRLIVARLDWLGLKIRQDRVFSVARENVTLKRDLVNTLLRIKSPGSKAPKRLHSVVGSGFDRDEFVKALTS